MGKGIDIETRLEIELLDPVKETLGLKSCISFIEFEIK